MVHLWVRDGAEYQTGPTKEHIHHHHHHGREPVYIIAILVVMTAIIIILWGIYGTAKPKSTSTISTITILIIINSMIVVVVIITKFGIRILVGHRWRRIPSQANQRADPTSECR